jgi:dienelactone hydrolase
MYDALRSEIRAFLHLALPAASVDLTVHGEAREEGFTRKAVSFATPDGDTVEAFLFVPHTAPVGAVVALHQHNSEWALGKSEIAGLAGDPLQAFGPALARAGVMVLAPDAVGFESRRGPAGYGPTVGPNLHKPFGTPDDWRQYYNHAMFRLVRGELLMTKILSDVAAAVTAIRALAPIERVGIVGHSHGGNVALFAAALDTRIAFACASGAVCSYRYKMAHGVALDMALVLPGFTSRFDLGDLMRCVAPRKLLVVSSDNDPFSADATELVASALPAFRHLGVQQNLFHVRCGDAHKLDPERFAAIVDWVTGQSAGAD